MALSFPMPPAITLPPGRNLSSAYLPNWDRVKAAVKAGTGSGKLVMLGESTFVADGAEGTAASVDGTHPVAPPAMVRRHLQASGIRCAENGFMGDGNAGNSTTFDLMDTRWARGGWANPGHTRLFGGYATASTVVTATFTILDSVDTLEVWYRTTPGAGSFTVNVDGGSTLATINCNATLGVHKTTISCSRAPHVVNFVAVGGGTVAYLWGLQAYDSQAKQIQMYIAAHSGGTAATFVNTWSSEDYRDAAPLLAADLTVINLAINDQNAPTSVANYTTYMNTIITLAKNGGSGDVILCTPTPIDSTQTTPTRDVQDTLVDALYDIADANHVPLIDLTAMSQNWQAVTTPLAYTVNSNHPGPVLYSRMAQAIGQVLVAL